KNLRQRRSIHRERGSVDGRPDDLADPRTPSPASPPLVSELTAWLEQDLLQSIESIHEKALEILELSLKGFANTDIARQVGLGTRSVQLHKKRMGEILKEKLQG